MTGRTIRKLRRREIRTVAALACLANIWSVAGIAARTLPAWALIVTLAGNVICWLAVSR